MIGPAAAVLLVLAAGANGLLAGASLDQSIKQLPTRRHLGAVAFSRYSRAGDLGNGVAWYATLGIGTGLLSLVAAGLLLAERPGPWAATAAGLLAVTTVAHSAVTARAAPINHSQRAVADDETALNEIFDRFTRWQTLRAVLQVTALLAALVALAAALLR